MDELGSKRAFFRTLDHLDADEPETDHLRYDFKLKKKAQCTSHEPLKSRSTLSRPQTSPVPGYNSSPRRPSLRRMITDPLRSSSIPAREETQVDRDPQQSSRTANLSTPPAAVADFVSDLPMPLPKSISRTIVERPGYQQIFADFFPSCDKPRAKRFRIAKAIEYGAKWTRKWKQFATHIIVDKELSKADLDKFIGLSNIKPTTFIVHEVYVGQCIEHHLVLDASQYQHLISGFERPKKGIAADQTPEMERHPLDQSLEIKVPREDQVIIPADTSSCNSYNEQDQDDNRATSPAALDIQPLEGAIPSKSQKDDLTEAIGQARSDTQLLLDSDDEDEPKTRPSTAEGFIESRLSAMTSMPAWQSSFACMRQSSVQKSAPETLNASIITLMQEMADHYTKIRDEWRARAYRIAISNLKRHGKEVFSAEDARKIPGVGPRLAMKIEEIKWTSRLRRLETAKLDENDTALKTFTMIYGVGPSLASKWISNGYRTLEDLTRNRVDLSFNQKIGMEHYQDFAERISREEVTQHAGLTTRALHDIDPAFQVIVGGSYRRGLPTCGDIDLIISHPSNSIAYTRAVVVETLVPRLTQRGFLVASLAVTGRKDGTKWHGACQLPAPRAGAPGVAACARPWRRIDLLLVPADELGAATLYFTGNDVFNRSMRLLARRRGMRLNQRGLYKDVLRGPGAAKVTGGEKVAGQNESDIFNVLGVPWRECTDRNA